MSRPLLIAHRGETVHFPENTIEAFAAAFTAGADGIELDIHAHNGALVVVHNYLFDRAKTYPTLDEVLEKFAGSGRIEIEIKALDLDFLPLLVPLIARYSQADLEVTTSVQPLVHYVREQLPGVRLGVIFGSETFEDWMPEDFVCTKITKMMALLRGDVAHIPWTILERYPSLIARCHERNTIMHSHIYGLSIEEQVRIYQHMSERGLDQCTFDNIALIVALEK